MVIAVSKVMKNKGLYALAFGTFGLGIAEFSMMSILPDVADDFGVSIAEAGHLISAYAIGVCVGAPLTVFITRGWKLRSVPIFLMAIQMAGNLLMAVSPQYHVALVARFISGLPHGAFFGAGSIIANSLAEKGKSTSAVAIMIMGMTIANLAGVPMGSMIGHLLSWRLIFAFAAVCGCATICALRSWVPELPTLPKGSMSGQFRFLRRREPWLLIMATMLGNGGVFCWYSYVNPIMTDVAGLDAGTMPFIMLLVGGSMCMGNYLGGRLSDRYTPGKVAMCTQGLMFIVLSAIFLTAQYALCSIVFMCFCTACLFAVSSPQQLLLLRHSAGGEMMGGAMVQLAFNLGNALGAFFGGLPIETGLGVRYAPAIGAVMAAAGAVVLYVYNRSVRTSATQI